MPPDSPTVGSAHDWLRHARSDLALAGMRKSKGLLYEHLCFHAQQAAEKALKAVLVHRGIRVPRSHDLTYLMEALPKDVSIPPSLIELPTLTKYAVQQRYPGEISSVTARHRRTALKLAQHSVVWATNAIRKKGIVHVTIR